jgi:hypothetical protein
VVTHPLFKYRVSYRRLMEVQARLLIRWLSGEIPAYPSFNKGTGKGPFSGARVLRPH